MYQYPERRNPFSIQWLFLFNRDSLLPFLQEEGHIEDSSGPTPCHAQVELGGSGEFHPYRACSGAACSPSSQGVLLEHSSS